MTQPWPLMELRDRIDSLRNAAGLAPFRWTDPVLRARVTPVRLAHLLDLRTALDGAFTAAGRAAPIWTDASPRSGRRWRPKKLRREAQ